MELQDFTEKEQEMIKKGLTFSKLSDKETADKIIALIPQEYIKRIPFFVRGHATGKSCEYIAQEYPELYAAFEDEPSAQQVEEMAKIINELFEQRMKKHNL